MYRRDETTQTGNKNHSVIGDLARVDPEAAARKILAAHRKHRGISAKAAGELSVYYQTLRSLIVRLSAPVQLAREAPVTITFTVGAQEGLTLEQAIAALRSKAKGGAEDTPEPDVLRVEIDKLIEKTGATLSAIAGAVKLDGGRTLDEGLFSRWRGGKKPLPPATLAKIQTVVRALAKGKKKTYETRGRRAASLKSSDPLADKALSPEEMEDREERARELEREIATNRARRLGEVPPKKKLVRRRRADLG